MTHITDARRAMERAEKQPEAQIDIKPTNPYAWNALPGSTPITLMQLNEYTCRWSVGDGSPQLFCGCHVRDGSPYCTSHARLGRGSGTPSEREIVARAMRISRSEGRSGFRGRQAGQSL